MFGGRFRGGSPAGCDFLRQRHDAVSAIVLRLAIFIRRF